MNPVRSKKPNTPADLPQANRTSNGIKSFYERGQGDAGGIAIIAFLIFIALLGARNASHEAKPDSVNSNSSPRTSLISNRSDDSSQTAIASAESSYKRSISLSSGNARSEYQPAEEYVRIRNSGREPINITGWTLRNGKGGRTYYLDGALRRFTSDSVAIGRGAKLLSPYGANVMQDIVLERGDTAIITTGRIPSQSPFPIVSFRENMCTGYLENMDDYNFTPSLSRSCPDPEDEIGLSGLDTACIKFVERLPSCRVPDFTPTDREGERCPNCVNNTPLSGACVAFIKERFNYKGCVAYHAADEDFYDDTWRVYLNHGWELWAKEYESISLFDQFGRLVDEITY